MVLYKQKQTATPLGSGVGRFPEFRCSYWTVNLVPGSLIIAHTDFFKIYLKLAFICIKTSD